MGMDFKEIKNRIMINFLSSRTNITVLQCVLYLVIGYIMGGHLNWIQFIIMFILLLIIQFITRIKATSDGMVFRELMINHEMKANDIVEKIKEQVEEAKRNNNIN